MLWIIIGIYIVGFIVSYAFLDKHKDELPVYDYAKDAIIIRASIVWPLTLLVAVIKMFRK